GLRSSVTRSTSFQVRPHTSPTLSPAKAPRRTATRHLGFTVSYRSHTTCCGTILGRRRSALIPPLILAGFRPITPSCTAASSTWNNLDLKFLEYPAEYCLVIPTLHSRISDAVLSPLRHDPNFF